MKNVARGPFLTVDLDGGWDFLCVKREFVAGRDAPPPPERYSGFMKVPGYWEECRDRFPVRASDGTAAESGSPLAGTGFYRRSVPVGRFQGAILTAGPLLPGGAVFCNGELAGVQYGSLTATEFDLGRLLIPDAENELVIAVCNLPPERGLPAAYGGRRGGVGGGVRLRFTGRARIRDWFVSFEEERPHWHLELDNAAGCRLKWRIARGGRTLAAGFTACSGDELDFFTASGEIPRWSDHAPTLCRLAVELWDGRELSDADAREWGAVRVESRDVALLVNGAPTFLRGAMESCDLTGTTSPHFSYEKYREDLAELKAAGFNFIRCRSWCPPEQFYAACDDVGLLVQTELPPVYSAAQAEAVIRMIRRHPCAAIFCEGHEKMLDDDALVRLRRLRETLRRMAPGVLYMPQQCLRGVDSELPPDRELPDQPFPHDRERLRSLDEFSDLYGIDALEYAGDDLFPGMEELRRRFTVYHRPCLLHEPGIMGGCLDVFRQSGGAEDDREEALRSLRRDIRRHGIWEQIGEYCRIGALMISSLRKQLLEDIRSCGFLAGYGYQGGVDMLWRLNGGPRRGDGFCRGKYGEAPEAMRRYNGDTVLICGAGKRRSRTAGEVFDEEIVLSHYGPKALRGAVLLWQITDADKVVGFGRVRLPEIDVGDTRTVARVRLTLPERAEAGKFTLEAALVRGREQWRNQWEFWSFPPADASAAPAGVRVRRSLDAETLDHLTSGGSVLLTDGFPGETEREVYRPHFPGGVSGHAGGIIHPHPVWEHFPHAEFAQWHFYLMMTGARSLVYDAGMPEFRPLLELIPSLKSLCRKALLAEFRVGGGRLMICGLRLDADDPAARWMRRTLLAYLGRPEPADAPVWPLPDLRRRLRSAVPAAD